MGLPFIVNFMKGKAVAATTSIQDRKQVKANLDAQIAGCKWKHRA